MGSDNATMQQMLDENAAGNCWRRSGAGRFSKAPAPCRPTTAVIKDLAEAKNASTGTWNTVIRS